MTNLLREFVRGEVEEEERQVFADDGTHASKDAIANEEEGS